MKFFYFIIFLVVIDCDSFEIDSTQPWTRRHLLGEEPYIPYHHRCVKSCEDPNHFDRKVQWTCCGKGWGKCCRFF